MRDVHYVFSCFFFNDTATTEIYTLSLHDALPISRRDLLNCVPSQRASPGLRPEEARSPGCLLLVELTRNGDRVHQRSEEHTSELQSPNISYAVFCLKKKKSITPHDLHSSIRKLSR